MKKKMPDIGRLEEALKKIPEECFFETIKERFYISWSVPGTGFGEFVFYNKKDKMMISNEGMGKDFIKKVMNNLIDKCELED
jgi:hypothetical protein